MAWATPHTWRLSDGTPTHTLFNTALIDNPASLRRSNDNQVKVYRSSNLSVANDTYQNIAWNAQDYEITGGLFDSGANTRLVAPIGGIWLIQAKVGWANNATGRRGIGYRVNDVDPGFDMQMNTANGNSKQNGADLVKLQAGDYVVVYAYQTSGGALNLLGSNEGSSSATLTLLATETTAPPWTAPRTWTDGDILTPHLLNTQWHDNLLNRRYFNGQAAKVSMVENLSVSSGQRQVISWDVVDFAVGSLWTNGSQFVAPIAGWYMVLVTVEWHSEPDAVGSIRGTGFTTSSRSGSFDLQFQPGSQVGVSTNGKAMTYLAKGEVLEIYAYHDSDMSLTIEGDRDKTRACVALMAA